MKGRKPKTRDLKTRQGNPGRRTLTVVDGKSGDRVEVEIVEPRTEAPDYLNEIAAELWGEIVPALVARKQFLELFRVELARYCAAFARWREAEKEIEAGAHIIKSPKGYPIQSPWLAISNRAADHMTRLAAEFGFNPISQIRLDGLQLDLFDRPAAKPTDGQTKAGDAWSNF